MKIERGGLVHALLTQLLALTQSSNAELYKQAIGLGIIKEGQLALKSLHYHIRKLELRQENVSHLKRTGLTDGNRPPSLAACRLFSSPRLSFSVRLIPFSYTANAGAGERDEYGVLGVVQELCSGILRVKMLSSGYASRKDLRDLEPESVVGFVAAAISLPRLKIGAIHFPQIRYQSSSKAEPEGLIAAWLGYAQPLKQAARLQKEFLNVCKDFLNAAKWGGEAYKLCPAIDACQMDFPDQAESAILDLTNQPNKSLQLRDLKKEVGARVDQWNLGLRTDEEGLLSEALSPVLRLWIARQCFNRVWVADEGRQRAALNVLCKAITYQKRLAPATIAQIQDFGIDHLSHNNYPIYR